MCPLLFGTGSTPGMEPVTSQTKSDGIKLAKMIKAYKTEICKLNQFSRQL